MSSFIIYYDINGLLIDILNAQFLTNIGHCLFFVLGELALKDELEE